LIYRLAFVADTITSMVVARRHKTAGRHPVMEIIFLLVVMIVLFFGIGSSLVASSRGGSGIAWFWIGVILGPIGIALAFTNRLATFRRKIGISEQPR
jgi:hypothetical protein